MHGTQRISRSLQYTTKVAFSSRPFSRLQAASAFLFAVRQPSDSEASRQVKRGVGIGVRRRCFIFEICASDGDCQTFQSLHSVTVLKYIGLTRATK